MTYSRAETVRVLAYLGMGKVSPIRRRGQGSLPEGYPGDLENS